MKRKVPLAKLLPEWIYDRPKKPGQLAGWHSRLIQSALHCCQVQKHRRHLSKIQFPSWHTTAPWQSWSCSTSHQTRSIGRPEGSFASRHDSTLWPLSILAFERPDMLKYETVGENYCKCLIRRFQCRRRYWHCCCFLLHCWKLPSW